MTAPSAARGERRGRDIAVCTRTFTNAEHILLRRNFAEHVDVESRLPPAELYAALKKDADDWHESRLIQYPWGRAFHGFGMRGDGIRFRIGLHPVSGITCAGVVEETRSGSRLLAVLRFSRWVVISHAIYFGAAACLGFLVVLTGRESGRSSSDAVWTLIAITIVLAFVALFAYFALQLYWARTALARVELRRLLSRVAERSTAAAMSAPIE